MKLDWIHRKSFRGTIFVVTHLAALTMILGFVLLPIQEFFADRDAHIAEQRKQLARIEGILSQEQNVHAITRQVDAETQQGEFLAAASEGLVSAELQARIKGFTESAGAHVRSAQNLPPKAVGSTRYSGSRVEIYGDTKALRKALHGIERARPYLFVAGANMKLGLPAGRPNGAEEPSIQVQLDVFAPTQIEGRNP
jgi:general secretion pathway protein M